MLEYRALVLEFPADGLRKFSGKAIRGIPDTARAASPAIPPMTRKTAKATLEAASAFFKNLLNLGIIDRSPLQGISIAKLGDESIDRSFTNDQLTQMFTSPLYVGCRDDERGFAIPGARVVRRGRFWIPLIALYSGARLGEICQLWTDDIKVIDNTQCIQFRANGARGQSLKTTSSRRTIPIHNQLIELGFVDWVEGEVGKVPAPLFPESLPSGSSAAPSAKFTKSFSTFLKTTGLSGRGLNFHSFRHTFRDGIRQAELSDEIAKAIGGWQRSEVHEGYGQGHKMSHLKRSIDKVLYEYDGEPLNLKHIRRTEK